MVKAHISNIDFVAGLQLQLGPKSIVAVIGPNNSGKSLFLSELKDTMADGPKDRLIIKCIDIAKVSTLDEIESELEPAKGEGEQYSYPGFGFGRGNLKRWWDDPSKGLGPFLRKILVSDLSTRQRLLDCDPVDSFDTRIPFLADHPFQRMYEDEALESRTSAIVRRAFKKDLIVDRGGGSKIAAYFGDRPKFKKGENPTTKSYRERLGQLDKLELQGDGVRSFASIVGRVNTEQRSILIVDEPEAFLHPPQARLIAELIVAGTEDRQTFIATHNSSVIQGLLTDQSSRVSVIRLTRTRHGGTAKYLPNATISALWNEPILRFSNVLDGLFHDGVIVTEADGDCRFYEAVSSQSVDPADHADIHYTYAGGKDRVDTVVGALAGLHVPVASVVDFDVLNNEQPLRRIIEAHGGTWSDFEGDWKSVKAIVEANSGFVAGDEFKRQMKALMGAIPAGGVVERETIKKVKALARNASPWDHVKQVGVAGIPAGAANATAIRLLDTLEGIGIFVVRMGQMEGFYRASSLHGPRWVAEVLQLNVGSDPALSEARNFTKRIHQYLMKRITS